jgi:glutathione S-transferase
MEPLIGNPAARTYAVCTAILVLKMIASSVYTTAQRMRHKGFINDEDARAFGGPGMTAQREEVPAVAHALRIQRNDVENLPGFFALALAYVLAGATPGGAAIYFWTYTVARVLHTGVYTFNLQPWRAICYGIGVFCEIGMITQIVRAAF